ncbi:MAG: hypothetical protein VYD34_04595 [Verrucomicrobiota bacterium]|nr:hypothetical protein [Verrucomicrobiota bacterium]
MKRIYLALLLIHPVIVFGQTPQWIWLDRAEKTETVYFRKFVELPAGKIKSAKLQATCDNGFSIFVNGNSALAGDNWNNKYGSDIAKLLTPGRNVITVEGRNQGGVAGFVAQLEITIEGKKPTIITDSSWMATRTFYGQWKSGKGKDWAKTISTGKMGDGPWGTLVVE